MCAKERRARIGVPGMALGTVLTSCMMPHIVCNVHRFLHRPFHCPNLACLHRIPSWSPKPFNVLIGGRGMVCDPNPHSKTL